MNILIGNTGLVGTTLKDSIQFDYEYNSSNISDLLTLDVDTRHVNLYLSCLPATKWLINKNPLLDLENIFNIINIISKRDYNNIILYSSIDVYSNTDLGADESVMPDISAPNYGTNRLIFERLITNTLRYNKLLIIRLPALFGKYIKKNILYDLLHCNNIDKINYNSKFQWYNLDRLAIDTKDQLDICTNVRIVNLFPEPIPTNKLLELFKISKEQVDTESNSIIYDYKTNTNSTGYCYDYNLVLSELQQFVSSYRVLKSKLAVCLFGDPRDILDRLNDWSSVCNNIQTDFYLAFYSNDNIYTILDSIRHALPVKSVYVTDNDLVYFDSLKFSAKHPIYIYSIDSKATFARITSQSFIRQKAISLVDLDKYDAVLLSRADRSNFQFSISDIDAVSQDDNLLIVNSGTHIHPGGGAGCTKCTVDKKCDMEYHANDICDLWCIGSPKVMSIWNTFFDNLLENYYNIQLLAPKGTNQKISYIDTPEQNEVLVKMSTNELHLIENHVHCYYPEKIIRSAFKDVKIVGASADKSIWT
jgi:hypothetical protein